MNIHIHALTARPPFLIMALAMAAFAAPAGLRAQTAGPPDKPVAAKAESATPEADANKPGDTSVMVAGREIRVTAPGTTPTINVIGPRAEVRVGPHLVVVEKDQLTLDGKALGQLPPDTHKVEVIMSKGTLSVKADGKEAAQAKVVDAPL